MLRAVTIASDAELAGKLAAALEAIEGVAMLRHVDHYPNSVELGRILRSQAPEVLFVSAEEPGKVVELALDVEENTPGVQVIAIHSSCDPEALLKVMRAGVREFLALPFERQPLRDTLSRVKDLLAKRPPTIDATDAVFSFLPAKAGSGASTLALNTSVALSLLPNTEPLLADFDLNSGLIRFMLKLNNPYSVTDAVENAPRMDDNLWAPMVSKVGNLDVLHAGKMNPNVHIDPSLIRHLIDYLRRNYRVLCFDLSGNLERYSLEIMQESKRIFLVTTPEIPALHLAQKKFEFLKSLELGSRVTLLVNRSHANAIVPPKQIEQLLGLPVHMSFANDYPAVHRAVAAGKPVNSSSPLGKQIAELAQSMAADRLPTVAQEPVKRRFVQLFSAPEGPKSVVRRQKAVI
jgi:Flp pilus assembly CpaE family ATPase